MNGYSYTRVWKIDHKLVVAETIEDAIKLFKLYMGKDYHDEPMEIYAVGCVGLDYAAIIKEEKK